MADRSFSIVFIIEAILKIVSLGFGVYLRNGWNKLDFFIVMPSIIDIIITYSVPESGAADIVGVAKIMHVFRAARPLDAVLRIEGLVVVLRAVMDAVVPLTATLCEASARGWKNTPRLAAGNQCPMVAARAVSTREEFFRLTGNLTAQTPI